MNAFENAFAGHFHQPRSLLKSWKRQGRYYCTGSTASAADLAFTVHSATNV